MKSPSCMKKAFMLCTALAGLVTYRLADRIRVGQPVNFIIGDDNKKGGVTQPDSGLMRLSAGGEIWYGRLDHAKISLAAYKDLVTRNTNEGLR